jgi:hypothetical protein
VDRSWGYLNCSQTHDVEIGTKGAQFAEKEYINGIFVAVRECDPYAGISKFRYTVNFDLETLKYVLLF